VGCSLGLATVIIHNKCSPQGGNVIGLDKSVEHLAKAKEDLPAIEFQHLDVLTNLPKLKQLGKGYNKIFVDLNVSSSVTPPSPDCTKQYIHACIHRHTYIHTYTCMHICIYTYIHVYILDAIRVTPIHACAGQSRCEMCR
jgi:hypothetical protein